LQRRATLAAKVGQPPGFSQKAAAVFRPLPPGRRGAGMDGDRGAGREKGLRIWLLIKMMADMHKLSAVILAVGLVFTACRNQSPDSTGADTSGKVSVGTRTDTPEFSNQIVGQDRNGRDLKVPQ